MNSILRRYSFNAMGSHCEIQIYHDSRVGTKKIMAALVSETQRLERKYSRFSKSSFLTEINASSGMQLGIKLDSETQSLFDHARSCFIQSEGLFDVTSCVLSELWDFKTGVIPDREALNECLERVGFDKLEWRKNRVVLPAGMEIDFGGIVKEYAADSLVTVARSLGVKNGLINLGGDFAVIGPQLDNSPWPVGISDPDAPEKIIAKIDLAQGGLASSGDYYRYFIHEGKRYSHIINPISGWPSSGLRAVSVATNLCTVAGSIATIAMLKPESQGKIWLFNTGTPHVFVGKDGVIDGFGIRDR